jgi:hypothetical protein
VGVVGLCSTLQEVVVGSLVADSPVVGSLAAVDSLVVGSHRLVVEGSSLACMHSFEVC